jgi:DMSO/TMAO reductase YedYZ molybdopterin-dependent catalytic subunit
MKRLHSPIVRWVIFALFAAACLTVQVTAQTNNGAVSVRGAVDQPLNLSLSDLQSMPRIKITVREKDGTEATFEGVSLYDIVSRARPHLTEKCCSNAINTVVIVKAADKYQALFSLPELDPKFDNRQVVLADRREGLPLSPAQGPLQIIVPDDKVHARWVRQVNYIEVAPLGDLRAASTNSLPP